MICEKAYQYFKLCYQQNFAQVQEKVFTVSLMWQWNIVLNLQLYFFFYYVQKLQWHEHFLELGN